MKSSCTSEVILGTHFEEILGQCSKDQDSCAAQQLVPGVEQDSEGDAGQQKGGVSLPNSTR